MSQIKNVAAAKVSELNTKENATGNASGKAEGTSKQKPKDTKGSYSYNITRIFIYLCYKTNNILQNKAYNPIN